MQDEVNFQSGDKVIIIDNRETAEEEYQMVSNMTIYIGSVVTVDERIVDFLDWYTIKEDGGFWRWHASMFTKSQIDDVALECLLMGE